MNAKSRAFWIVLILAEVVAGGGAVALRAARPAPPDRPLSRLPVMTATDLEVLRERAASDRPTDWFELGSAWLAYGYIPDAEACLRRAASQAPADFDIVYAYAWSLDRLGRLDEAFAAFERAALLEPGERAATCRYHEGLLRLRADAAAGAEAVFQQAGPDHAPAILARARLRIRAGSPGEAVPLIEGLRSRLDPDVRVEMVAERMYRELNRPVDARAAIEKSERSREYVRVWDHFVYLEPIRTRHGVLARQETGRMDARPDSADASLATMERTLNLESPDFTERMYEPLADMALSRGRLPLARTMLAKVADRMSLPPSARHLEAAITASSGDEDRAIALWHAANAVRPNRFSHRALSTLMRQRGRLADAERHAALSALLEGIAAYRANELPSARGFLERSRSVLKDDPRPEFYLGEIELALGNVAKAEAAYQRCLDIDPNHGRAIDRMNASERK